MCLDVVVCALACSSARQSRHVVRIAGRPGSFERDMESTPRHRRCSAFGDSSDNLPAKSLRRADRLPLRRLSAADAFDNPQTNPDGDWLRAVRQKIA